MRAFVAKTLLLLAVFGLGGAWIVGSILVLPRPSPVPPPPPPARVVHLAASDGVPIAGSYWPGARPDGPAVLLLHGVNNTRDRLRQQAIWLNGLGYAVLAIDFRGHGESGAAARSFGWHEGRDAAAALSWLRADAPGRRVGVIGISQGGAAALLGEGEPLDVQAMVLHAVYPDLDTAIVNRLARIGSRAVARLGAPLLTQQSRLRYGVDPARISPIQAIGRYRGQVLILAGTADRDTRLEDSQALYAAAPGPKELWLLDGAGHVQTSIVWNDAYRERVGALFARALGPP